MRRPKPTIDPNLVDADGIIPKVHFDELSGNLPPVDSPCPTPPLPVLSATPVPTNPAPITNDSTGAVVADAFRGAGDPSTANEIWVQKYWRPSAAYIYLAICTFDFILAPIAMMIMISSVLTWNIWTNRFIIPVLMAFSIVLASLTVQLISRSNRIIRIVGAGIVGCIFINSVFSIPFISTLTTRPLIPQEQYVELSKEHKYFFGVDPATSKDYLVAVDEVKKLPQGSKVGLNFSAESLEFQLWALANIDFKYEFVVFPKRIDRLSQVNKEVDAIVCFPGCDPQKFRGIQLINIGM